MSDNKEYQAMSNNEFEDLDNLINLNENDL